MRYSRILLPVAALVVAALALAQTTVRPGQYEVTAEVRLPGESTLTTYTELDCITPEEASDLQSALVEQVASDDSCDVSNLESSAGKITFDSDCDGIVSKADITFTEETITFVLSMTAGGQSTTSTSRAKWIGPTCAADDE